MKRYILTECYELLHVDPKTFRSWLQRAGIEPIVSKADPRVKYLTEDQVQYLASEHDRVLHSARPEPEVIPPTAYKLLGEQVETLERSVASLGSREAAFHSEALQARTSLEGRLSLALEDLRASLANQVTELGRIVELQRREHVLQAEHLDAQREEIRQVRSELTVSCEDLRLVRQQSEAVQAHQAQATNELRQAVEALPGRFETLIEERLHEVYDETFGLKEKVAADLAAIMQRIDQVEGGREMFVTQLETVRMTVLGSELRADAQDQALATLRSELVEIQARQVQARKQEQEKTPERRTRRKVDPG